MGDAASRTNLATVPSERRCNAVTRASTACRNWGMRPSGRCRMHGGASRRGIAAPRYRHGLYSTDWLCRAPWDLLARGDPTAHGIITARLAALGYLVPGDAGRDTPCTVGDPMDDERDTNGGGA